MDDKTQEKRVEEMPKDVPYIVFEGEQVRNERNIKRLIIALVVTACLLFISNIAWLVAWVQYDYVSETVTVDSKDGGDAHYVGNESSYVGRIGEYYADGKGNSEKEVADEEVRQVQGN